MKRIFSFSAIFVLLVLLLSSCFLFQSYNLTGTWLTTLVITASGYSTSDTFTITQNGNAITVVDSSGLITLTGTVNGNNVQFSYSSSGVVLSFTGTISDSTHMNGTWTEIYSGVSINGTWSATKQ